MAQGKTRTLIRDVAQLKGPEIFASGACAGGVYSLVVHLAGRPGPWDMELMWGTWLTGQLGLLSWWVGFVCHLIMSGFIAFGYAAICRSARRSGPRVGVVLGLYHWVLAGACMMILPALHPMIPEVFQKPGLLMLGAGLDAAFLYLVAHLAFGATVGLLFDIAVMCDERPVPITHRAQ